MSEWQSIETAPMDGTYVDVWTEYPKDGRFSARGERFPDVFWNGKDWVWEFEGMWPSATDSGGHVTHWMPLPDPPTQTPSG